MPRRKKDALVPLPEIEKTEPETKVEIALAEVKKRKKRTPVVIEYDTDDEDEPEFSIEPIRGKPTAEPVIEPPQPAPPVKEKRKYVRKPKAPPQVEAQPMAYTHEIYKQLERLERENQRLRSEQSLTHVNRLSHIARVMKIKF
jgi:hypothetical protein